MVFQYSVYDKSTNKFYYGYSDGLFLTSDFLKVENTFYFLLLEDIDIDVSEYKIDNTQCTSRGFNCLFINELNDTLYIKLYDQENSILNSEEYVKELNNIRSNASNVFSDLILSEFLTKLQSHQKSFFYIFGYFIN